MEFKTSHETLLSSSDFLHQLEKTEEIIKAYSNLNEKLPRGIKTINPRVIKYKDDTWKTSNEIYNFKYFILENENKQPDDEYNSHVSYIDRYDDYKGFNKNCEKITWSQKFSHLYDVFEGLIIPSLTADNVQVVEKTVQVQGLDANTFWTAKGAKATIVGVWVAAISFVGGAFISLYGINKQHEDAVLDRHNQVIQQTIPQSQSEPITPENSTIVVPTEIL